MMIQCMIQRAGDTVVTRGGVNYVFRQNTKGHAVCEVQNDDHARIFLRMGDRVYRPYGPQAEAHARALNMIPKKTVVEDEAEAGEVFEESVEIAEGKSGDSAADEEEESEQSEDLFSSETPTTPEGDDLVRSVAARMLDQGAKKGDAVKQLREQFDLSAAEAGRIVDEVKKQ